MRYSIAAHARDKKALSLGDAELGLLQQHKGSLPLNVSQAGTDSSVINQPQIFFSCHLNFAALIMDISPSDYPWDDGQDLQDIICGIEEDFPPDSSNRGQPYAYTPYNNPLFQMFNTPLPQAPPYSAPPYSAPALAIAPTPFSPSLVPGPSAPSLASPSPAPAAPAPSTAATCTAPSESTFSSTPNPAPIIRPINFIMVMDGEKGKRVSKKTGIMKPKPIVQAPPALNDYNPRKPKDDPKIVLIIQEVRKNILEVTVRDTRLTDQKDREETVKSELTAATQKHFPTDAMIWSVVLDTINSLGYNPHIGDPESLDCLFIVAVSAVYCCLDQVPKGKKLLFTKENYGFIYDRVELFMEDVIYADQALHTTYGTSTDRFSLDLPVKLSNTSGTGKKLVINSLRMQIVKPDSMLSKRNFDRPMKLRTGRETIAASGDHQLGGRDSALNVIDEISGATSTGEASGRWPTEYLCLCLTFGWWAHGVMVLTAGPMHWDARH
ncbi:hypothetical protein F4604DRAFT_1692093 [Suillus subluteus]|nr:hypothetical protein F4604DRAFT_1692093 [Suillus subluteus]